jgi:hypothetical protein
VDDAVCLWITAAACELAADVQRAGGGKLTRGWNAPEGDSCLQDSSIDVQRQKLH